MRFTSVLALFAFTTLAGVAFAANPKDLRDCDDARGDARIAACTRVIKAGDVSTNALASAYNKRAIAWGSKGDSDKAFDDYSAAIRTNPSFGDPYHNRALILQERKEYDRAIADFNLAIKFDPNYAPSWRGRADCWDFKKEHQGDRRLLGGHPARSQGRVGP